MAHNDAKKYLALMTTIQPPSVIKIPLQYSEINYSITLGFEQSSLARNGQLEEFVDIFC